MIDDTRRKSGWTSILRCGEWVFLSDDGWINDDIWSEIFFRFFNESVEYWYDSPKHYFLKNLIIKYIYLKEKAAIYGAQRFAYTWNNV